MFSNNDLQTTKQRFGIIGNDPDLNRSIAVAVQVANTDLSVLVTGESGTGKENFPKIIHHFSARKHERYIAVNCGAIPEGTIDSELFGHEKGSFTGALSDRKGYFEVADKGTIFLDEVGELPLSTQARLLRVLEVGEFIKVGSSTVLKTNVRVIAATNLNMAKAIQEGRFREDLYYRLNVVHIEVPPLRNRKEDILPLFQRFVTDFSEKYHRPVIQLDHEAKTALKSYYWHGNIRQLKNVAEQISAIVTNPEITHDELSRYLPDEMQSQLPLVINNKSEEGKSFKDEREILYRVLFDMKKDMDELKKSMQELRNNRPSAPTKSSKHQTTTPFISYPEDEISNVIETHEDHPVVEETPLSVEEMEKGLIRKALEKHKGKRKYAALDLKISERTLYRKIKEYGLE